MSLLKASIVLIALQSSLSFAAQTQPNKKTAQQKVAYATPKNDLVRSTKVDDYVDYDKQYNVKINPAGFIFNAMSITGEIKVDDSITVGPQIGLMSYSSWRYSITGFGIGARAKFTFTGNAYESSLYVSPSAMYERVSVRSDYDDEEIDAGYSVAHSQVSVGYQWFWRKGFNMNVGGGFGYVFGGARQWAFIHGLQPAVEFELGYAF